VSLGKKFPIHAAGGVSAVGAIVAPAANNYGGFTVAVAVSVYSITLTDPIDRTERAILVTPRGVLDSIAVAQLAAETDVLFTISTADAATATPADRAFDFAVLRLAF
jgi:hypothetical protein